MKRNALLVPIAFLMAGCGGVKDLVPTPFAGSYVGTYTLDNPASAGTLTFHVANDTGVTGTLKDTTTLVNANMVFTSNFLGVLSGNFQYPGSASVSVTGAMVDTGDGIHYTATLAGTGVNLSMNLTRI